MLRWEHTSVRCWREQRCACWTWSPSPHLAVSGYPQVTCTSSPSPEKGMRNKSLICSRGTSAVPAWSISNRLPCQQRGILRPKSSVSLSLVSRLWEIWKKEFVFPNCLCDVAQHPCPINSSRPRHQHSNVQLPQTALSTAVQLFSANGSIQIQEKAGREAGLIQKLSINLDVKYDVKDLVYIFLSQIYLLRKLNLLILWLPPIPVLVIHSISYCEPFTFIKNKNIKTWS